MSSIEIQDRRVHPRLELEVPVPLQGGNSTLFLRDISANGASFDATRKVEEMTGLAVHLELDGPFGTFTLDCTGVVIRCVEKVSGGWNLGVYFQDLPDEKRLELEALIDARLQHA